MSILKALGYTLGRLSGRKGIKPMASTQGKRIANAVTDFVNRRNGIIFTASELRGYVRTIAGDTAPASADRIMRQLRQAGVINYELVNRNASQYKGVTNTTFVPVANYKNGGTLYVESGRTSSSRPNGCGGEVA